MTEQEWTEEQRRAIARREGDLLLDAAAGSGKTSVLVERFVAGVLDDGVPVARMLAITFTEKAAAELRDRIRERLRARGAPEFARETESAFISTIHGFCARVLRANALTAGLDPGFAILDRDQTEAIVAAAFDDALGQRGAVDPRTVDLVAAYGAGPLRAGILAVYDQLRSAGEPEPRLAEIGPDRRAQAAAELDRARAAVVAELGAVGAPVNGVLDALARLERCRELLAAGDVWPPELDAVKLPRTCGDLRTDACDAYDEALQSFREAWAAWAAGPVRDQLDALLAAFGERYALRKRELSGLDFEDLELICARLLARDGELRERYAARFDRIMVDEFQDTNRVQLSLIESIARSNLFTVGDAQQSIYGFRHAELELFEQRGARLAREGARETLSVNFRSRPAILTALNLAFEGELRERFKPLRAGRPALAGDHEPAVEIVLVDKGADWLRDGVASPWRLGEAGALAAHIAGLTAGGRPAGEIVVLMRATPDMRAYERALEAHGLPTYVIGGRGYWSHPQVVDLVCYLRALANPRDEEALYSVIASPLVGVSIDALVVLGAVARAADRDPWWALRDPGTGLDALGGSDRALLSGFTTWFGQERERAARAATEELIDAAVARTGYDVAMLAMPGGRRRLANVRKLMRLAREHEDEHGPDLRGFLARVAEREAGRAGGAHESEAPVEGEGLNAIRLMTIHRAKGLEFPVVCVADLGRSVRPAVDIVRVGRDGRLGLRLARAGVAGREPALAYRALGEERRVAEEAEERRLFYVAMTRARERLVLSGATKFAGWTSAGGPTGGGPVAWIAPAFVPDLGVLLAQGGGEAERGGVRIVVSVTHPEPVADGPGATDAASSPGVPPAPALTPPAGPPPTDAPGVPPAPALTPPAGPPPTDAPGVPPAPALTPPAGPPPTDAPPLPDAPPSGSPVAALSYSSLGEYERCGYRFYAERVLGLPPAPDAPVAPGLELSPGSGVPPLAGVKTVAGVPPVAGVATVAGARPGAAGPPGIAARAPGMRGAADRGVLVHALLERLDYRRPVVPALAAVVAAAAGAGLTPAPGPEEADELAGIVRRFADSELCARLGRALDVRREERFAYGLGTEVLIVGALDVLAREPGDRLLVVDYKTDRLDGAQPAAIVERAYAAQRLIYALAALRSGAAEVEVAHCFLERPAQTVSGVYAQSRRPELEAELRARSAGVLERRFEVTPAPYREVCAGCPAEGGMCSWPLALTRRGAPDTLF